MNLSTLDWGIIGVYFLLSLSIGLLVSKKSGSSAEEFFLSGRNMAWWLLGVSMVATTFSSDTPNLVTGLVRQSGVSGNWGWWAFCLTGMLTVFVFAKLWRRANVMTDIEFYELRYSGPAAAFLRGFRALYLGLIFNVLVIGSVSLAAVKFGQIMLGWPGWQTLLIAGSITLAYSAIGGLKAVIITDFFQFILAMTGSIWACIYLVNLDEVGGLSNMLQHANVNTRLSFLPDMSDAEVWIPVFLVPIAVQWWASYYPGAEPGGGGYIAQRMFSAKNEKGAISSTLMFNFAHYALRSWPWILVALASLIVFPELKDIQSAFPALTADKLGHDVAYPAMLTKLPSGLLGLVAASLIAAYMSTISTQLNLGASYLVNDFFKRFINPQASEKQLVNFGRIATVVTMVLGTSLGLVLTDATQAFNLLLLIGAGTGLIYILRWFWWRINATTEIIAMVSSLIIAGIFTIGIKEGIMAPYLKTALGALLTTLVWITAVFLTPPEKDATLFKFFQKIRPAGPGWNAVKAKAKTQGIELPAVTGKLPLEIMCMLVGCAAVYSALFGVGYLIYGQTVNALVSLSITILSTWFLMRTWQKIQL